MSRRRRDASPDRGGAPKQVAGLQPVLEAIRSGRAEHVLLARAAGGNTHKIVEAAHTAGVRISEVSKEELDRRAGGARHQGVVAQLDVNEVDTVEVQDLLFRAEAQDEPPLVVLLDGIQDPMNFGAILRSAFALGAHGVVIPKHRAAQISPTVIRASAGAALHLPVARVVNLKHAVQELQDAGVVVVATSADGGAADETVLTGPLALIIGSEGEGVRPHLTLKCDGIVRIPQLASFDSLNASVAAGILLYEVQRQRREAQELGGSPA